MKKIVAFLLAFFVLSASLPSLATGKAVFSYTHDAITEEIKWGLKMNDQPSELTFRKKQANLPFWYDPSTTSSHVSGYSCSPAITRLKYKGQSVSELTIFYSYEYDHDGIKSKDNCSLYMIKASLGNVSNGVFNAIIRDFKKAYGNPIKIEGKSSSFLITNGFMGNTYTYEYDYSWDCSQETGVRVTASKSEMNNYYEDVIVYMGKTNMDATLEAEKTKNVSAVSYVTATKAKSVYVTNEKGITIMSLEPGSVLRITGYNSEKRQFHVQFTINESRSSFSSSGISLSSSSSEYEGYISGEGLVVSRDYLTRLFKEEETNTIEIVIGL